jgi:hypothetical protein
MKNLSHLSLEEIDKLIEYKKQSMETNAPKAMEEHDYSHASERGPWDAARDLGYGVIKGASAPGELLAKALTGGRAPSVDVDFIKSPHPSLTGDTLQTVGEFFPVGGSLAFKGAKAIAKLPFTQKSAAKGLEAMRNEYGHLQGQVLDSETAKNISSFLKHPHLSGIKDQGMKLLDEAGHGGYEAGNKIQSLLSHVSRELKRSADPEQRLTGYAAGLHKEEVMKDFSKFLSEHIGEKAPEQFRKAQQRYSTHKKVKDASNSIAKKGLSGFGLYEAIRHLL